jgi:hypothetical protein
MGLFEMVRQATNLPNNPDLSIQERQHAASLSFYDVISAASHHQALHHMIGPRRMETLVPCTQPSCHWRQVVIEMEETGVEAICGCWIMV